MRSAAHTLHPAHIRPANTCSCNIQPAPLNSFACCIVPCSAAAHVPLDAYIKNLVEIVHQLQAAGVQNILLMTPPPVNEAAPDAVLPGEVSRICCQLPCYTRKSEVNALTPGFCQVQSVVQEQLASCTATAAVSQLPACYVRLHSRCCNQHTSCLPRSHH
jgi:hypothetical protein